MNNKYCVVPLCFNSTVKTPAKLFFCVPKDPKSRKKWMTAIRRRDSIGPKTVAFCCEDHFDVEKDMANYVKYKLVGGRLKLKKDVVPHKFACQTGLVEKPERPVIAKLKIAKLKAELIENIATSSHDLEQLYIVEPGTVQVENFDIDPLKATTGDTTTEDNITKKKDISHKVQDDAELNSDDDVSDAEPSLYDSSKDTQHKKTKQSSAGPSAAAQGDEHEGFKCNTCQGAIFGFRYTCVECVEFDMCAACERRGAHAYHYVLRVPGPRPRVEVRALVKRIRREVLKVVGAGDDSSGDGSDDASDDEPDEIPKSEVKLEPDAGPDPLQPHSEIVKAFDAQEVSEIKLEFESGDETEEPTESEAGAVTSTVSRQPVAATPSAAQLRTLPQAKLWPVLEISQGLRVGQSGDGGAGASSAGPPVEVKVELPAAPAAGGAGGGARKGDSGTLAFEVFTHAKDTQKEEPVGSGGAAPAPTAKRKPAARPAAATQRSAAKRKK